MSSSGRNPARLYALATAAELLSRPDTSLGRRARASLSAQTGLSPEGVEYALSECLEVRTPRAVWSQLLRQAPQAKAAHVVLSANAFTGAFRAIALALAQSDVVQVRPSRREPGMAQLLLEASGGIFDLVEEISPQAGDHVWVYGSDATIATLRENLPSGVQLHRHGSGMGAAVVQEPPAWTRAELRKPSDALAQDIVAFDQRGCLSPRILLLRGSNDFAEQFLAELTAALVGWEKAVPRGRLSETEEADARRYVQTMSYVATCLDATPGLVAVDPERERLIVPPVGRYLHVTRTDDPLARLLDLGPRLTSVGFFHPDALIGRCVEHLGARRYVELGQMQRPPLDGPVDLRTGWSSESL